MFSASDWSDLSDWVDYNYSSGMRKIEKLTEP